MASDSSVLRQVWQQLQGTWHLDRKLHSTNTAEPSGNCKGTATFTIRPPAVFIDDDGVFQNASQEMLYSEQGIFEMAATDGSMNVSELPFSRKYVWRLQDSDSHGSEITIWFVKPGTEKIDYLFHKALFQHVTDTTNKEQQELRVECNGGHLCVEDWYSSVYTFHLRQNENGPGTLGSWNMLHEVTGPRKDQVIETDFIRT